MYKHEYLKNTVLATGAGRVKIDEKGHMDAKSDAMKEIFEKAKDIHKVGVKPVDNKVTKKEAKKEPAKPTAKSDNKKKAPIKQTKATKKTAK